MNSKVIVIAFFALVLGLAFCANDAQATDRLGNSTLPATPNGTLPTTATVTPNGTLPPGGTLPATETPGGTLPATTTPGGTTPATTTPGGTLPATTTPGGTIPATTTPATTTPGGTLPTPTSTAPATTPTALFTPIASGTPTSEPTTSNPNLPDPESILNMSIGVNKQVASFGDVVIFSILVGNISKETLQALRLEVDTPANTQFLSNRSSPGWQLVSIMPTQLVASTANMECPDKTYITCSITLPGLMQSSIAVVDYAIQLDDNTPVGADEFELNVRLNGEDFKGQMKRSVTVSIDPTRRQFMPLVLR